MKDAETGNFICQDCGASYTAEALRGMLNDSEVITQRADGTSSSNQSASVTNAEYESYMVTGDTYFNNGDYALARAEYSKALLSKEGDVVSKFMSIMCELWTTFLGGDFLNINANPLMRLHAFVDEEFPQLLQGLSELSDDDGYWCAYTMAGRLGVYFINMHAWKMEDAANASSKTAYQWSIDTVSYFEKTWADILESLLVQAFNKRRTVSDDDLRFFLLAAKCGRNYGYAAEAPFSLIKSKYGKCHASDDAVTRRASAIKNAAEDDLHVQETEMERLASELDNLGKAAILKRNSLKSKLKTAAQQRDDAKERITHAEDLASEKAWEDFLTTVV